MPDRQSDDRQPPPRQPSGPSRSAHIRREAWRIGQTLREDAAPGFPPSPSLRRALPCAECRSTDSRRAHFALHARQGFQDSRCELMRVSSQLSASTVPKLWTSGAWSRALCRYAWSSDRPEAHLQWSRQSPELFIQQQPSTTPAIRRSVPASPRLRSRWCFAASAARDPAVSSRPKAALRGCERAPLPLLER